MARDGSGNWIPLAPVVGGTVITSTWANNMMTSFGADITESLDRSGRGGMLVPFRIADGTKAEPGYSWTAELSTGFYRDLGGADMRVSITNTDIFRWNTTGAQISYDDGATWNNVLTDGGSGSQVPVNVGTADGQTLRWEADDSEWQATDILRIEDSETVAIRPQGATTKLIELRNSVNGEETYIDVNTNGVARVRFSYNTNANDPEGQARAYGEIGIFGNGDAVIAGRGNFASNIRMYTSAGATTTERMRIDSVGNVGIGTDAPAYPLDVSDTIAVRAVDNDTGYGRLRFLDETGASTGQIQLRINTVAGDPQFRWNGPISYATVFSNGNNERMRIDATGNVGIGTDAPTTLLHVSTSSTLPLGKFSATSHNAALYIQSKDSTQMSLNAGASTDPAIGKALTFSTADTERMRIDTSGAVGIGTTNPLQKLHVSTGGNLDDEVVAISIGGANTNARQGRIEKLTGNSGTNRELRIIASVATGDTQPITFWGDADDEFMRIDSDGNLLVGRTSGALARIAVESFAAPLAAYRSTAASSNSVIQSYSDIGGIETLTGYSRTQGDWFQVSDARLKHSIRDIEYSLDTVAALRPVHFKWNGGDEPQIGFIAQEAIQVVPEAVSEGEDGFYAMGYANLVPVLVKAIQELTARLEALENG